MSLLPATVEDVRYCFRLLLEREPDEAGEKHWRTLVEDYGINVPFLVDHFLHSEEYSELRKNRRPVLVELDKFKIFVRPEDHFIGWNILKHKAYEPLVTAFVENNLATGDTFLDIGGNIGYFTLLASAIVGPTGHVFTFEANRRNTDLLSESIRENAFTNVSLFNKAVDQTEGVVNIRAAGVDTNSRIIREDEDVKANLTPIESVSIDYALKNLERLDMIKMDIEGAEGRAFNGMKNVLSKFKPLIVFEFSPVALNLVSQIDPVETLQLLTSIGYRLSPTSSLDTDLSIDELMAFHQESGLNHIEVVAHQGPIRLGQETPSSI